MTLSDFLLDKKKMISMGEGRRLASQEAIQVNSIIVKDLSMELQSGDTVQVGKRYTEIVR